ncbi:MAG: hypothetical protein A2233_02410 [Candidatus Kerfeldbacteria bacterium RIFOXYA2_FULL_38_24]|uniref:Uncharacterized protein n=1 Tax=Candidatus Kerfeldbacteria bacterium RIFOXYB2_FULL_38_14 TaxID=1798547 RepID=A0A1G2B9L4_9BACT|nr:MAG: hypothetical protein A2233_02410 [Candidatus Kerfeldbacteria bacterium RIFOXYA2_FULL_38_24]OGY85851.1 MAG: hypothetical protein A2319_05860 [Candidatus Kerfeldbacteria bacterium RIFOXYB2_FULL_38_14]OGY89110.1 MAG: hypothetical protein A2458_02520 [Candidatus Kerfeldbacteria bacterium RIFOXYC2_FULL_38_9]
MTLESNTTRIITGAEKDKREKRLDDYDRAIASAQILEKTLVVLERSMKNLLERDKLTRAMLDLRESISALTEARAFAGQGSNITVEKKSEF